LTEGLGKQTKLGRGKRKRGINVYYQLGDETVKPNLLQDYNFKKKKGGCVSGLLNGSGGGAILRTKGRDSKGKKN